MLRPCRRCSSILVFFTYIFLIPHANAEETNQIEVSKSAYLEAFDKTEAFALAVVRHRSQLVPALSAAKNRLQGNRELINHVELKETHELAKKAFIDLIQAFEEMGYVTFGKAEDLKHPVSVRLLELKKQWKGHSPPNENYFKFEGSISDTEVNDPVLAEKFVRDHLQQLERATAYSYFLMLQLTHEHGFANAESTSQFALRASLINSLDHTHRVYTTVGLMTVTKKPVNSPDTQNTQRSIGSVFSTLDLLLVHANGDKTPLKLQEKINRIKNVAYNYFGQWSFDMAIYYQPPSTTGGKIESNSLTVDKWLAGIKLIHDIHLDALNLVPTN